MSRSLPQPLSNRKLFSPRQRTDEGLRPRHLALALVEVLGGVALLQSEVSLRALRSIWLLLLGRHTQLLLLSPLTNAHHETDCSSHKNCSQNHSQDDEDDDLRKRVVGLAVVSASNALAPEPVTTLGSTFATPLTLLIHIERPISRVADLSVGRARAEVWTVCLDVAACSWETKLVRRAHLISINSELKQTLRTWRRANAKCSALRVDTLCPGVRNDADS